jgi:hypothetical protein
MSREEQVVRKQRFDLTRGDIVAIHLRWNRARVNNPWKLVYAPAID